MKTFQIGDPLDAPIRHKCFLLRIDVMHGDADLYESVEKAFGGSESERACLSDWLDALGRLDGEDPDSYRGILREFAAERGQLHFEDAVLDDWPRDLTSEGRRAAFQGWALSYFDADGIERAVFVED